MIFTTHYMSNQTYKEKDKMNCKNEVTNETYEYNPNPIHLKDGYYVVEATGYIPINKNGEMLRDGVPYKGYLSKRHNGRYEYRTTMNRRNTGVHRVVAYTFLPCKTNPDKLDVNHIDGNPSNNKLSNLEWANRKENNLHAVKHGLNVQAKKIMLKNLRNNKVTEFDSLSQLARHMDCSNGTIHQYIKNNWGKPFRGFWTIYFKDGKEPDIKPGSISAFGRHVKDDEVVVVLSKDSKHVVFPNKESMVTTLGYTPEFNVWDKGSMVVYLNDLNKFALDIDDVLNSADIKHDLIDTGKRKSNSSFNNKPTPVRVTNKETGEVIVYNSLNELTGLLNISYSSLRKSVWRTKGDFKGYLFEYLK